MKKDLKIYSDQELLRFIENSKSNVDLVFKELYRRYSNHVLRFCMFFLNSNSEAEDVFQEVFIQYYNQIVSLDFISPRHVNVKSYLLRSAKSKCLNKRASNKSLVSIEELDFFSEERNLLEGKELKKQISESIELLDGKYKEAFILKEIEGMTFKEVAEHLGLTLSGAQSRVVRAKERLVELLSPYVKELK